MQIFTEWHNSGGANIEYVDVIQEEFELLYDYTIKNKDKLVGVLEIYSIRLFYPEFLSHISTRKDVFENLTRPKFPVFDKELYIEKYKLIPGKTVFVIPQSNAHGTLPLYFWIMAIEIIKLMGYKVIVNASEGTTIYGDVTCCYPPLNDIVPFCNLCGTVFSIRTGLVEMIASESSAKIFVFSIIENVPGSALRSITLMYPHVDNTDKHIVEIPLPPDKKEFYWIKNVLDERINVLRFMRDNLQVLTNEILVKDDLYKSSDICSPHLFFYEKCIMDGMFMDQPALRCNGFCEINYRVANKEDYILFRMDIEPVMDYTIHVALRDVSTKKIVKFCEDYNSTAVRFIPDYDGVFSVAIHILHPLTKRNCYFESNKISFKQNPIMKLIRCNNYNEYNEILYEIKKDLIIFLASKDAHICPGVHKELGLKKFGVISNVEDCFRYSWLCIIDGGKVVRELESQNLEVSAEYMWDGNVAHVISNGFNVNNNDKTPVSIKINNVQTCVNRRGLNYVIWDKTRNKVVDSVCFDTYLNDEACRLCSLGSLVDMNYKIRAERTVLSVV